MKHTLATRSPESATIGAAIGSPTSGTVGGTVTDCARALEGTRALAYNGGRLQAS